MTSARHRRLLAATGHRGTETQRRRIVWSHCGQSRGGLEQSAHPHDVVRRRGEGEDPVDERSAAMPELPEAPDRLHPPEALLDELPLLLTDGVPRVARGAR